MRRSFIASILILAFLLTSCQPKADAGSKQVVSANQFFETTPTSSVEKGSDEDLAKAVVTATKHSSYPTPKSTYLAPSTLVTYSDPSIPTSTSTKVPSTATKTSAPVTNVPSSTATATKASTTSTVQASTTPTIVKATNTPIVNTPTATLISYSYAIQSGTPVQIQNFVNSSSACAWQGIAGQVFDAAGSPQLNIVVKAGGTWNGSAVSQIGLTGLVTGYGEGGYQLVLGTKAVDSAGTVWVQIYDLAGNALSDKVVVATSSDCTKNLVLLNFKQISQ